MKLDFGGGSRGEGVLDVSVAAKGGGPSKRKRSLQISHTGSIIGEEWFGSVQTVLPNLCDWLSNCPGRAAEKFQDGTTAPCRVAWREMRQTDLVIPSTVVSESLSITREPGHVFEFGRWGLENSWGSRRQMAVERAVQVDTQGQPRQR